MAINFEKKHLMVTSSAQSHNLTTLHFIASKKNGASDVFMQNSTIMQMDHQPSAINQLLVRRKIRWMPLLT